MVKDFLPENLPPFTFRKRDKALPGDLRPVWRISLVMLILSKAGRGNAASLQKIHVLNWALRSRHSRRVFLRILEREGTPDDVTVRFEPALNRAIHFAAEEGIVELRPLRSGGLNVQLTKKGVDGVGKLAEIRDAFAKEREFLGQIRGRVTEQAISRLLNWGAEI